MTARQAELETARVLNAAAMPDTAEATITPATRGRTADLSARTNKDSFERGTRALARLLQWTPFLDLHRRAPYPDSHHVRAEICFMLDLAVRAVVISTMLFVAAAIAWKAVAPLPHLWS